jgi:hypothetical protein
LPLWLYYSIWSYDRVLCLLNQAGPKIPTASVASSVTANSLINWSFSSSSDCGPPVYRLLGKYLTKCFRNTSKSGNTSSSSSRFDLCRLHITHAVIPYNQTLVGGLGALRRANVASRCFILGHRCRVYCIILIAAGCGLLQKRCVLHGAHSVARNCDKIFHLFATGVSNRYLWNNWLRKI